MTGFTRRGFLTVATAGAGAALLGATPAVAGPDRLKSLVDDHLAKALREKGYPGLVLGAFDRRQSYSAGAGRTGAPGSPAPKPDTIFQIGSITKTFTGLAVALGQCRGRLRLTDPMAEHLPAWLPMPVRGPRPVTVTDVATHTSGLPPLPPGLAEDPELDPEDPYAAFSLADLAKALPRTELVTDPGSTFAYSNYGFGLLGQALGARDDRGYDALARRITVPLGLSDTTVALSAAQRRRKAQGHAQGVPTKDWRIPTLAGAGALYGTVADLLRYLRAHLGGAPGELAPALALATQPQFTVDGNTRIGLAWVRQRLESTGHEVVWHNGGTGGFRSFAGYSPETGIGVAALTNSDTEVDSVAFALLETLLKG
ncbi:serine hydrolase domain-containing protein [Amycolatopsis nigrescens]|uniref:serine hydrolase domain-containing protein n=1 Tax=Amycolatopsis nigrescens TaxID=381445 RepID=UPI00035FA3FE|nr:serine hydrolase domain-containing protein [Amycolatopsis nigrescens]